MNHITCDSCGGTEGPFYQKGVVVYGRIWGQDKQRPGVEHLLTSAKLELALPDGKDICRICVELAVQNLQGFDITAIKATKLDWEAQPTQHTPLADIML